MTLKYIVFYLILSCFSCSYGSIRIDHVSDIIKNHSKGFQKTNGLSLEGTGGYYANFPIETITLKYWSPQKMDLAQSRKLYVKMVESFVKKINEDFELQPYLKNHPFNYNNTDISIGFSQAYDTENFGNGQIASVYLIRGEIYYYIHTKFGLERFYIEPYEEALRIVKEEESTQKCLSLSI